ncbi:right-handed parallel beta-helix repeat-containing protein [Nocardioides sp.]|uniref:right-handed parallel beta-helix repeat-containing protein n=1 Tax=Nocardioides sp. TaxID=35761 RepID=UPI00286BC39F|nr:right-handed parallel beta-helix repeat-containing protein [Nocardioides sp.]
MSRIVRLLLTLLVVPALVGTALTLSGGPAGAHEERPAVFPKGNGARPAFLGYDNPRKRVVCKGDESARRIRAMPAGAAKQRNLRLLPQCRFSSIQDAVRSITRRRTSVYVLPGVYEERKWGQRRRSDYCSHLGTQSDAPLLSSEYIGSISSPGTPAPDGQAAAADETDPIALSYADQRRCFSNLNLISVFGDKTPGNSSIACDSQFCGTQIVGTGRRMSDVVIDNDFQKLNAIRLDRAGGAYVTNMTLQQAEFNAIYVLETDGFVLDRLRTRGNDEYGILAFASDHGLIQRSDAYYNGDSGIYPGSASDLNADNPNFEVTRYAIEIRNNRSHHNTLGYSGTAGNSVWAHHNKFYDNATGIATDSLFPGHPGLPQDHARWNNNEIFRNNTNWYTDYVDTGVCDRPMPERGYIDGAVCPVVPTPVGTGVLIAGGNSNSTDHNWIYDNWRFGTMQFWVPAPLRDEMDPRKLYDTSNDNHTFANHMGSTPDGRVLENGMDHWWDDQGVGNCWERNVYADGSQDDNFVLPPASCAAGGSVFLPGMTVKDAGFLTCSQYDRADPVLRHPAGCNWFDSPSRPSSARTTGEVTAAAPAPSRAVDASAGGAPLLAAAGGLLLLLGLGRRRRARAA